MRKGGDSRRAVSSSASRQTGGQAGKQAGRLSRTRANGQSFEVWLKARRKALTQIRGVPNELAEHGLMKARARYE